MKIKGRFCERTLTPLKKFAPASLRWKRSGKAWLLVGCPKGKFKNDACVVGTHGHKILTPTATGRCRTGARFVKK